MSSAAGAVEERVRGWSERDQAPRDSGGAHDTAPEGEDTPAIITERKNFLHVGPEDYDVLFREPVPSPAGREPSATIVLQ